MCKGSPADHGSGLTQDFYYQKAVDDLKASSIWQNNQDVRDWFESKWLCISKVNIIPKLPPVYYAMWCMLCVNFGGGGGGWGLDKKRVRLLLPEIRIL